MGAAILIALVVAGSGWWALRLAARRSAVARRLGERVQQMRDAMRRETLLPLHDTRPARSRLQAELESLEAEAGRTRADGATEQLALGWGWLAIDDAERGLAHMQAAYDGGERGSDVEYGLGLAQALIYSRELERLGTLDRAALENARKSLRARYRDPALAHLREGVGAHDTTPSYVEALIAFYDEDYGRAQKLARDAQTAMPSLFEAARLEGRSTARLVLKAADVVNVEESTRLLAEMLAAYDHAEEIGRSDPVTFASEAADDAQLIYRIPRPEDKESLAARAQTAAERALAADSAEVQVARAFSSVLRHRSTMELFPDAAARRRANPALALQKAIDIVRDAERKAPDDPWLQAEEALDLMYLARLEEQEGRDPRALRERAISRWQAHLERVRDGQSLDYAAQTFLELAFYRTNHGLDARADCARSVAMRREAFERESDSNNRRNTLAASLANCAEIEMDAGRDAAALIDEALALLEAVRRFAHETPIGLHNVGAVLADRARWEVASERGDPLASLQQSIAVLTRAVELKPERGNYAAHLARSYRGLAVLECERSGRSASIEKARAILSRASAGNNEAELEGARLELTAAACGGDRSAVERAAAHATAGLSKNDPNDPDLLAVLAEAHRTLAERRLERRSAHLSTARQLVAKALAVNPAHWPSLVVRAAVERLDGDQPAAEAAEALATRINPGWRRDRLR
jgi:serine/threonine-protein kinase